MEAKRREGADLWTTESLPELSLGGEAGETEARAVTGETTKIEEPDELTTMGEVGTGAVSRETAGAGDGVADGSASEAGERTGPGERAGESVRSEPGRRAGLLSAETTAVSRAVVGWLDVPEGPATGGGVLLL
jgi:hypothetical protein